jgi:hypothetical protein
VTSMRRLALVFALIAAVSTVEQVVLSETCDGIVQTPNRIRRALVKLSDWRAFLIGPLQLLQRAASNGGGRWLGQGN